MAKELIGAEVSHSIWLNRMAVGQGNEIIPVLEEAADYLRGRLQRTQTITDNNLPKVLEDVEKRLSKLYSGYTDDLESYWEELAALETAFQVGLIGDFVDRVIKEPATSTVINRAMKTPMMIGKDQSAVSLRAFIDSFVNGSTFTKSGATNSQVDRVLSAITGGQAQGLTTDQIVRNIVGTSRGPNAGPGILEATRQDAMRIARTSTNHIATQARMEIIGQNDDILIGYRLVATLDGRTSQICRSYDQRIVLNADQFKPYPPFHQGCRTTAVPELRDDLDVPVGTRASRGEEGGAQVSGAVQYYGWLKTQSAAFQDDILGPTMGKAFRNSGLTTEQFRKATVDRLGNPLTIEEMRRRDNELGEYLRGLRTN